jgi:hypothetical protein
LQLAELRASHVVLAHHPDERVELAHVPVYGLQPSGERRTSYAGDRIRLRRGAAERN